jgi:hypothetical protein
MRSPPPPPHSTIPLLRKYFENHFKLDSALSNGLIQRTEPLFVDSTRGRPQAAAEFKSLARNRLDERTLASPAAADGAFFIRTEKHLFRIQSTESTKEIP